MTATPPQERSSRPRPAKPSPQARERANEGPRAPLRRSPDEDRDCATAPGDDAGAAAERELLRLCFVHAKDVAWAQWFYECCFTHPQGKVAGLAYYRAHSHGKDALMLHERMTVATAVPNRPPADLYEPHAREIAQAVLRRSGVLCLHRKHALVAGADWPTAQH